MLRSEDLSKQSAGRRKVHAIRQLGMYGYNNHTTNTNTSSSTTNTTNTSLTNLHHPRQRHSTNAMQAVSSTTSSGGGGGAAIAASSSSPNEEETLSSSPGGSAAMKRMSSLLFKGRVRGSESGYSSEADVGGAPSLMGTLQGLLEWDSSWETPCALMGPSEWRDPYVSTSEHSLLRVATKRFCVCLAGACGLAPELSVGGTTCVLEDVESYKFLFEDCFVNRPHCMYIGKGPRGAVVCACEVDESRKKGGPTTTTRPAFRVLVLDKNGYQKSHITSSLSSRERLKQLRAIGGALEGVVLRKPDEQQALSTQLMIFEKKRIVHHAKFGVLYRKAGQKEENELFGNKHGSAQFIDFLKRIGTFIELKGHAGFRGGLDTKENLTGDRSVYTVAEYGWNGAWKDRPAGSTLTASDADTLRLEIMFHVGTLLPLDPTSDQQLQRKRHIGNDIVTIIFCEGSDAFNPEVITSNFCHVFLLVRPVPDDPTGRKSPTHYRVAQASLRGVRPWRPYLPEGDALIPAGKLRPWLITKLINAERAAMYSLGEMVVGVGGWGLSVLFY